MPRREDHEVHKDMWWWHWIKRNHDARKNEYQIIYVLLTIVTKDFQ
jgi:hypothetical protein